MQSQRDKDYGRIMDRLSHIILKIQHWDNNPATFESRFEISPYTRNVFRLNPYFNLPMEDRGWTQEQMDELRNLFHRIYIAALNIVRAYFYTMSRSENPQYGEIWNVLHRIHNNFFVTLANLLFKACHESQPFSVMLPFAQVIDSLIPPINNDRMNLQYYTMIDELNAYTILIGTTEGHTTGSTICIRCHAVAVTR